MKICNNYNAYMRVDYNYKHIWNDISYIYCKYRGELYGNATIVDEVSEIGKISHVR